MNEKFNKNWKVKKFTKILGIAVRLIVIDPLINYVFHCILECFHLFFIECRKCMETDAKNHQLISISARNNRLEQDKQDVYVKHGFHRRHQSPNLSKS